MATHPGSALAQPPRRWPALPRRAGPVLALAAAVLLVHAWLVALLAPDMPRTGMARGSPVLLRSLPPQDRVVDQVADPTAGPAAPSPAARPVADLSAVPAPRRPAAPPTAPTRLVDTAVGPAAEQTVDGAASAAPRTAVTDPQADVAATADPDGEPPPLHATRVPPPVSLHYALQSNGRAGHAVLQWQHDGSAYRLTLDAQDADGRALLAQASTGVFDAHGLAPERFVDRRGGGRQRAANFRRDLGQGGGRISYSGPGHDHPAWPGAQDRLSWLAQLAAILAAADTPPASVRLFVADATGQAGTWRLQRQADAAADTVHWRREPPRPEGLRIDLWLPAPGSVPAERAGWPLRLLFTVPRSGAVLSLVQAPAPVQVQVP